MAKQSTLTVAQAFAQWQRGTIRSALTPRVRPAVKGLRAAFIRQAGSAAEYRKAESAHRAALKAARVKARESAE